MFVFMILIAIISLGAVTATVVAVSNDGYGRIPEKKFVRSF